MSFEIYYIDCYKNGENLGSVNPEGEISKNGDFKKFYNRSNAENYCAEMTDADKFGCKYSPSLYVASLDEYDTDENKTELIIDLLWELKNSPIVVCKKKQRKGR